MTTPDNPYAVPNSNLTGPESPIEVKPVGGGRRLANLAIDYATYLIFSVIIGAILGIVTTIIWGDKGIQYIQNIPSFLLGVPILIGYYLFFEGLFGRTVGKFVTGTRVVNELGLRPSFKQILGRTFARLIPFEAFSFLGSDSRGWHDSLSKTFVVRVRKA